MHRFCGRVLDNLLPVLFVAGCLFFLGFASVTADYQNRIDLKALGRQLYDYVDQNFDNVGADFAKEALKIHYGVSEPRNIRGVSTKQEEKTLKEEGIQFFKFPMPAPQDTDS